MIIIFLKAEVMFIPDSLGGVGAGSQCSDRCIMQMGVALLGPFANDLQRLPVVATLLGVQRDPGIIL